MVFIYVAKYKYLCIRSLKCNGLYGVNEVKTKKRLVIKPSASLYFCIKLVFNMHLHTKLVRL